MPQVAISDEFLKAFAKLPKPQQKKVRAFVEKFRADPTHPSINYEPIHDVVDDKVRTVRVDKTYRAIVIHPPKGDVYLCVWVDHHDDAMAWARNKRFEVNPKVGSLQVYELNEEAAELRAKGEPRAPERGPDSIPAGRLMGGFVNDDLLLAGVPEPLIPAVRALRTEYDLDELSQYLPAEASDALYMMAAGATLEEALDEAGRAKAPPETVDITDFATALQHPDSMRRFMVPEDEVELREVLAAPLELWRVFLHPSQRSMVEMKANGPVRVLGGAGTGKTVVAMHRAKHLAANAYTGADDRILFTTFTANLAADIRRQLKTLCGPELERIEVVNLDAWSKRFLKAHGIRFRIAGDETREDAWGAAIAHASEALDLPLSFYKEEWDQLVQANGITDRSEYLRVKRTGRGRGMNRKQRAQVWQVFANYRENLEDAGVSEWADMRREAWAYLTNNPDVLPYKAVVADEVQDLSPLSLRLLRAMVAEGPNDLFVVGDAHQRIYAHKTSLGACGINIRGRRSRRLRINYRTTEKIRDWAVALLHGIEIDDLDDGIDNLKGYRSLRVGVLPLLRHCKTEQQEAKAVVKQVKAWLNEGKAEEICVVARTDKLLTGRYEPMLNSADIKTVRIHRQAEDRLGDGVRVATMHRVKGIEFPKMLLAGVQKGTVPLELSADKLADKASREDHEHRERCLLFVAATRARDELVVTGFGERSAFVNQ